MSTVVSIELNSWTSVNISAHFDLGNYFYDGDVLDYDSSGSP